MLLYPFARARLNLCNSAVVHVLKVLSFLICLIDVIDVLRQGVSDMTD